VPCDVLARFSIAGRDEDVFLLAWPFDDPENNFNSEVGAQLVSATGQKVSPQIELNACCTDTQDQASVALFKDSGFAAVWRSFLGYVSVGGGGNCIGPFDATANVFGRIFDLDEATDTLEFRLNLADKQKESRPHVATFADGSFVVVWQSCPNWGQEGLDNSGCAIMGQRFDNSGNRLFR